MTTHPDLARCICGAEITDENKAQKNAVETHVVEGQVITSYTITGCNKCLGIQDSTNHNSKIAIF